MESPFESLEPCARFSLAPLIPSASASQPDVGGWRAAVDDDVPGENLAGDDSPLRPRGYRVQLGVRWEVQRASLFDW